MNGTIARELRKLSRLLTEKHWADYVFIKGRTKILVDDCSRAIYKGLKAEYKGRVA